MIFRGSVWSNLIFIRSLLSVSMGLMCYWTKIMCFKIASIIEAIATCTHSLTCGCDARVNLQFKEVNPSSFACPENSVLWCSDHSGSPYVVYSCHMGGIQYNFHKWFSISVHTACTFLFSHHNPTDTRLTPKVNKPRKWCKSSEPTEKYFRTARHLIVHLPWQQ